jgi:hypothetical protein
MLVNLPEISPVPLPEVLESASTHRTSAASRRGRGSSRALCRAAGPDGRYGSNASREAVLYGDRRAWLTHATAKQREVHGCRRRSTAGTAPDSDTGGVTCCTGSAAGFGRRWCRRDWSACLPGSTRPTGSARSVTRAVTRSPTGLGLGVVGPGQGNQDTEEEEDGSLDHIDTCLDVGREL